VEKFDGLLRCLKKKIRMGSSMSQEVHQSLVKREQWRRERAQIDDIVSSLAEVNTLINARYRELGANGVVCGGRDCAEEGRILTDELKKLYGVSDKVFDLSLTLDKMRREEELRKVQLAAASQSVMQAHICASASIVGTLVVVALALDGK